MQKALARKVSRRVRWRAVWGTSLATFRGPVSDLVDNYSSTRSVLGLRTSNVSPL